MIEAYEEAKWEMCSAIRDMKFEEGEDPVKHIELFEQRMRFIDGEINPRSIYCNLFFKRSLAGAALSWYEEFDPHQEKVWEVVRNRFMKRFYDPKDFDRIWRKIAVFRQAEFETLNEGWNRYCEYLASCPHHGFTIEQLGSIFYRGLHEEEQHTLDFNSQGNFETSDPDERLRMIGVYAESDCGRCLESREPPEGFVITRRDLDEPTMEDSERLQRILESHRMRHEAPVKYMNERIDDFYKMFKEEIEAMQEDIEELKAISQRERRYVPKFRGQLKVMKDTSCPGAKRKRTEEKQRRTRLMKSKVDRLLGKSTDSPIDDQSNCQDFSTARSPVRYKRLCMMKTEKGGHEQKDKDTSQRTSGMNDEERKIVGELFGRYNKGLREARNAVEEFSRMLETQRQRIRTEADATTTAPHAPGSKIEIYNKEIHARHIANDPPREGTTRRSQEIDEGQKQPTYGRHHSLMPFIPPHQGNLETRISIMEGSIAEEFNDTKKATAEMVDALQQRIHQINARVEGCVEEVRNIKLSIESNKVISKPSEKHEAKEASQEEKQEYVSDKDQAIQRWSEDDTDISDAEDLKEDEAEPKVDRLSSEVDRLSPPEEKPTYVQTIELLKGPLRRSYPQRRRALEKAKAVVAIAKERYWFLKCMSHIQVYEGEPGKGVIKAYNCMINCAIGSTLNANCLLVADYSVNIISSRIAKGLGAMKASNVIFILDDGSIGLPEGRIVNVPIQFRGKRIKTHFLVYNFKEEPICPVILGHPFMEMQGIATRKEDDQHTCVDKSPPE